MWKRAIYSEKENSSPYQLFNHHFRSVYIKSHIFQLSPSFWERNLLILEIDVSSQMRQFPFKELWT